MEKEKEETERRRNMTDAEIRELDKDKFVKEKKQLRFMQKYLPTTIIFYVLVKK